MKKCRIILLLFVVLLYLTFAAGCWNYREVDNLAIVAGVAVDKGQNDQFEMTVEIIDISSGRETKMSPQIITSEGKTIFDAARNLIAVNGKRLYWSHTKVVVISKEIAYEGLLRVVKWYSQDSETREDIPIVVSKTDTAKEIFKANTSEEKFTSDLISEALENQKSLGKTPVIDVLHYDIETQEKGASIAVPAVNLKQAEDKKIPEVMGTAIIKDDKLVGFLSGDETVYLNFIRDDIESGVLVEELKNRDKPTYASLEIDHSKTGVKAAVDEQGIIMNIDIRTIVAVDETSDSNINYDEEGIRELEQSAQNTLNAQIESLIKKMQSEYDADIFNFAANLWINNPKAHHSVIDHWDEVFKNLRVNVNSTVIIENTATLSKSVEME
jgi:spore germination protein KC